MNYPAPYTEPGSSDPDEETLPSRVCKGATIGAGCTIGNDLTIGQFAMVGMGSLVTRDVPDFHLVMGGPPRSVGAVCRCGKLMTKFADLPADQTTDVSCAACDRKYSIQQNVATESSNT